MIQKEVGNRFDMLSPIYYQNSVGVLLIYDASIFQTFEDIQYWASILKKAVEDITIIIVGSKSDLITKDKYDEQKLIVESYCNEVKCLHLFISAKTGDNIKEAFDYLINNAIIETFLTSDQIIGKRRGRKLEIPNKNDKKEKKNCSIY